MPIPGQLIWDQPFLIPGLNLSIIPYALTGLSKDYEQDTKTNIRKEVGTDAKIALTSSLNLDLTFNPDYSQVEVDRQVTNLDRFELFFPERRQFFLENNDLFGNFGFINIRPFFSRRIGLGVPISFGARLSGNIDKNWRIGVMDMQTKKDKGNRFACTKLCRTGTATKNICKIKCPDAFYQQAIAELRGREAIAQNHSILYITGISALSTTWLLLITYGQGN